MSDAAKQNINISDISLRAKNSGGAMILPIRSEKRILTGKEIISHAKDSDYHIEQRVLAGLTKYNQYVIIRIKGRTSTLGTFDAASTVAYRFLINPETVQITRQTVDAQAQTRSGWQIGVWGEDFITVTLSGKTPGRYFSHGLTDQDSPWTLSYRNLTALEVLFENNGCWFEGEQVTGSMSPVTRRIKMQGDVELTVGEFIWYGMFESMQISESSSSPYLATFHLGFTAWREVYNPKSPYNIPMVSSEVQKGHTPNLTLVEVIESQFIASSASVVDPVMSKAPPSALTAWYNDWWNSNTGFSQRPPSPAPPFEEHK